MRLTFDIISWGAWSPLYQQALDWRHWQAPTGVQLPPALTPKLQQVSPNQRRRLSPLTKILLAAAFQAQPPSQCRSIFASQHGEINRTMSLLNDITHKNSLSPTSFSQSVHNTASGIFSILTHNQAASTAIAAGSSSLSQAFIEAYGLLHENAEPILLVYGDEPVPAIFKEFNCQPEWPIAMAFVLTKQSSNTRVAKLTVDTVNSQKTDTTLHYGQMLQALACRSPLAGIIANQHWSINCD
ncbi:beta-ketoacyl synthase chain length factor [Shewanella surugensis]|uniref:Beta-ketoacyl synthase chain length factor n=1 Tax=Shewanella surugensis TaxID=212020 RepID=A0ABT0LA60_9GAMM|nr:beta-ketoacyl synthase chain length factor [Shewanella surugensis]MCL1124606.1 beta-ketoacyl synthase chain length factor [Shewanella surugensis]